MPNDIDLAGAIRIELISLVLETKAQPLYQTPKLLRYYITKKYICQLFLRNLTQFFQNILKGNDYEEKSNFIHRRRLLWQPRTWGIRRYFNLRGSIARIHRLGGGNYE